MRHSHSQSPAPAEATVGAPLLSSFDTRQMEVAFTAATLVLLLVSVGLDQSGLPDAWVLPVNVAGYFFGGFWAARETVPELLRGKLDVDFLMIFAAVGAALIGHWQEGMILLFLFSLSNTLQTYAMERSRRAIDDLMHERPQEATVLRDGAEVLVPVEEVRVRELVILRPGEMAPTDGVVRRGQSEMNEASITGESTPADKAPGDVVYAGAMNGTGTLDIEVTRLA